MAKLDNWKLRPGEGNVTAVVYGVIVASDGLKFLVLNQPGQKSFFVGKWTRCERELTPNPALAEASSDSDLTPNL